jgi:hypothetical protein
MFYMGKVGEDISYTFEKASNSYKMQQHTCIK